MCIEKVVYMMTGEDFYCKVYQCPRLLRVVPTPNLQHGRQDPSKLEATKSADHSSEQSAKYEETLMMSESYYSTSKRQQLGNTSTDTLLIASRFSQTIGVSIGYAIGRGREKCNPKGLGSQAKSRKCNESCAHV